MSLVTQSQRTNHHPQLDKISPIGDLKYPIGDMIPNWVFSSVSPLFCSFILKHWILICAWLNILQYWILHFMLDSFWYAHFNINADIHLIKGSAISILNSTSKLHFQFKFGFASRCFQIYKLQGHLCFKSSMALLSIIYKHS